MQSPSVVFYKMAPGRDAGIPIEHFSELEKERLTVFLVCDRYGAYKKLVKNIPIIVLAFCWAHVRLDFLDAAHAWPDIGYEKSTRCNATTGRSSPCTAICIDPPGK